MIAEKWAKYEAVRVKSRLMMCIWRRRCWVVSVFKIDILIFDVISPPPPPHSSPAKSSAGFRRGQDLQLVCISTLQQLERDQQYIDASQQGFGADADADGLSSRIYYLSLLQIYCAFTKLNSTSAPHSVCVSGNSDAICCDWVKSGLLSAVAPVAQVNSVHHRNQYYTIHYAKAIIIFEIFVADEDGCFRMAFEKTW